MTLALRPAPSIPRIEQAPRSTEKDITGCVRALTRLLSVVVAGLLV